MNHAATSVPGDAEPSVVAALMRGTSHVMVLLEADGTLRWCSPSVAPVLGYDPSELVGTSVLDLLHPDDLAMTMELLTWSAGTRMDGGLDRDDARSAMDLRFRHRDGRWITIEALTSNFLDSPGIGAHLAIGRDVTPRRAWTTA